MSKIKKNIYLILKKLGFNLYTKKELRVLKNKKIKIDKNI